MRWARFGCLPIVGNLYPALSTTGKHKWRRLLLVVVAFSALAQSAVPLNLSPLIEKGRISEALAASHVDNLSPFYDGSYSALVTTNHVKGDAMWFWHIPAQDGNKDAPTVMWLQGGPGAPSSFGLFTEIGPAIALPNGTGLVARNHTWNEHLNLLIVDNPSGVGFSPLGSTAHPVTTEEEVGIQLRELARQWALLFPVANRAGLIIAGESYGGKYAPAAAAAIDSYNRREGDINLVGLVVADGWCDPATHAAHSASMLYGLIDGVQRGIIQQHMQRTLDLIAAGDLVGAFDGWNSVWRDYSGDYPGKSFAGNGLFANFTGGTNTENIWFSGSDPNIPSFADAMVWLTRDATRHALHLGNMTLERQVDQYHAMIVSGDMMNSSKPLIEAVLQAGKYKVLLYNGAWDGVLGAAVSEPLYAALEWPGKAAFNAEARHPYKVAQQDKQVAGWVRHLTVAGTQLTRVVIRRAGHMLPADQPRAAKDMIERFAGLKCGGGACWV